MCEFCNNIITLKEQQNINRWDRLSRLVKDNDTYLFWTEVNDYYYSGPHYLGYVKYCPKCGRKLDE